MKMDVDPWLVWGNTLRNKETQHMFDRVNGLTSSDWGELGAGWFIIKEGTLYHNKVNELIKER